MPGRPGGFLDGLDCARARHCAACGAPHSVAHPEEQGLGLAEGYARFGRARVEVGGTAQACGEEAILVLAADEAAMRARGDADDESWGEAMVVIGVGHAFKVDAETIVVN